MRRTAVQAAQMNFGLGGLREALKKILQQFDGEIGDLLRFDFGVNQTVWAATQINRRGGKGFVHRHQEVSSAENSFFGAQSSLHRLSERDANVFNGVVLVNVQIAFGGAGQIE